MNRRTPLKPTPTIEFGVGAINNLSLYVPSPKGAILIVTGSRSFLRSSKKESIEMLLADYCSQLLWSTVAQEPSPDLIDAIVRSNRKQNINLVIGIGGGSVLDTGKAVSAMLPSGLPVQTFLEGVGSSAPTGDKIPYIAIPTTSGTGSEATSNAVVSQNGPGGFKKSLRHDNYIPNVALIDPLLMVSCPRAVTAACGMDTFSQLVEAYLSTKSFPETDAISLQGIQAVHRSLINACHNGEDITARSQMAFASLFSGICLLNAGLGAVHGLAPALGSLFPIPHGVVCGTLMAVVNDITLRKIRKENSEGKILGKYAALGKLVSGKSGRTNDYYSSCFIDYLYMLTEDLKLPRLSAFGVTSADLRTIAAVSSSKNNPTTLSDEDLQEIIAARL